MWLVVGSRHFGFNLDRDRPHEPQQLPRHCCYRLLLVFASAQELAIPPAQPLLSLPGDLDHWRTELGLASSQRAAYGWPMSVSPSCLHCHPPQVSIAALGDATASLALTTGIF